MKFLRFIFTLISLIAIGIQIYVDYMPDLAFGLRQRLFIVCVEVTGFCIAYFIGRKKWNKAKRKKYFRVLMIGLFAIYLSNLIYLLFIDGGLGRQLRFLDSLDDYVSENVNLIPFHTIMLYVNCYKMGTLSMRLIIINLVGNIVAFVPMGFFVAYLFKHERKFRNFFLTMTFIILLIEFTQVYTMTGSGDIDDYILNMIGCLIGFIMVKIFKRK